MAIRNIITAFATVFPAELPDKTMVSTLVLASRFRRPFVVWCGVALAFAMHVSVAVGAGSLINRLPEQLVGTLTALLFAGGAVVLWRGRDDETEIDDESLDSPEAPALDAQPGMITELGRGSPGKPATVRTILLTSFVTVGLAEWGDLTQLATASLAARRGDPFGVGIGAYTALLSVAALAAFLGKWILRVVPLSLVRRIAVLLFASLAIWTSIDIFR